MKTLIIGIVLSVLLCTPFFNAPLANTTKPIKEPDHTLLAKSSTTNLYKQHLTDAIERQFNKALAKKQIIGAAIAIVKCDSIIYIQGFGNKNSKLTDPIDEKTIFRIGSLSKGFAGILAGIQVEKGLLDWQDKIADYVPTFQLKNEALTHEITLSHVLSHSSGLPYHSLTNLIEDGLSLEIIANEFKRVKLIGNPNTIYSYQNAAFALSGTIIEKINGKSYSEIIKSEIFEPLHMESASTSYEALKNATNVAQPHKWSRGRWRPVPIHKKYYNAIAAGGVNASISDMAKWMEFLLGHDPDVLTSNTMDMVFSPIIPIGKHRKYYQKWPGYIESSYGMGWRIHTLMDPTTHALNKIIHHGGQVNNYRSEIAIFPEEDIGICILFNSSNGLARTIIPRIHEIIKESLDLQNNSI